MSFTQPRKETVRSKKLGPESLCPPILEATAEATIFGVRDIEGIRGFILTQVRGLRLIGVEVAAEAVASAETGQQILAELKRIRDILEKGLER